MIDLVQDLAQAQTLVENGRFEEAFPRLNHLKAQKRPLPEVDYFRALCFLDRHQPWSAIEALKEELRYWPDNAKASVLLAQLSARHPVKPTLGDKEFQTLFSQVSQHTMLSEARLLALFNHAKHICQSEIAGNFVECGVAAGGSSALLAAVIARHSRQPRRLFSCDTFDGMPPASGVDLHDGEHALATGWDAGTCAAPETSLLALCDALGIREIVQPIKGLFRETLPVQRTHIGAIAFLHLDGDWYSSTWDVLENLYDQVMNGGRIQIDDYGWWEGCKKAVTEFEKSRRLRFKLNVIDQTGVWFEKDRL
jgi:Macrocin-O-methyltransferase (TylF)